MGFLDNIQDKTPPPPRPTGPRVAPSEPYAAKALQNELRAVETAAEGTRNDTLTRAAFSLRSLINSGSLDEASTVDQLTDAARAVGLDDIEIERTIRSGFAGADQKVGARTVPVSTPSAPSIRPGESNSAPVNASPLGVRLLTPTGLRNLPEPKPLIDNVLDQGTTALLYGKWASSKSFIALDWACSVAAGRPWQGRPTEQARVLYVVAEGVAGFSGRLDAWEVGWRTKIQDGWMRFLPMPINLMSRDVESLVSLVENDGYGFVVFDTLARCMVGGDENSARDAGIAVDAMAQVMYATPDRRGVVLGVHHTGKDGKTLRGSSAFESGVDTVYFTERDGSTVHLKRTKRKDGPEKDVHKLRLSPVEGTDSCVVDAVSGDEPGGGGESTVLLKKIFTEMFSHSGVGNTELRQVAADLGMSPSELARARTDLLREGWIVSTSNGARQLFEIASQGRNQW